VGEPVRGCHDISLCGPTTELPASITVADDSDMSTTVARTAVFSTSPMSINLTSSDEPKPNRDADSSSNIALMLREENPSIAFNAQFHLFYIVGDADTYVARFDIDPTRDTGGTLRISIKFKQYDHVSVTWF